AMGTLLYARGVSLDACFDVLNLNNPRVVQSIHADYIAAGADCIETNTFGANRFKLAVHGLEGRVREVNRRGVVLARDVRESSGRDVFVLGSIGPLGKYLAPLGTVTRDEALAAFREQAEALLEGGVDGFIVETFSDLEEVALAVAAIRAITDVPIIAQMAFTDDGVTFTGRPAAAPARDPSGDGHDQPGRGGYGARPAHRPAADLARAQARRRRVRRHGRARSAARSHGREARAGRQAPARARRRHRRHQRRLA